MSHASSLDLVSQVASRVPIWVIVGLAIAAALLVAWLVARIVDKATDFTVVHRADGSWAWRLGLRGSAKHLHESNRE